MPVANQIVAALVGKGRVELHVARERRSGRAHRRVQNVVAGPVQVAEPDQIARTRLPLIAADGPTLFARLLAASLATIFFAYAFVNMGMVSGILPVVGVPLPFISYGGTAMVTLGLALGMLMSIAKARRLMQS